MRIAATVYVTIVVTYLAAKVTPSIVGSVTSIIGDGINAALEWTIRRK